MPVITEEALRKRLEELVAGKQQLETAQQQVTARINAFAGAIAQINGLLAHLAQAAAEDKAVKTKKAKPHDRPAA